MSKMTLQQIIECERAGGIVSNPRQDRFPQLSELEETFPTELYDTIRRYKDSAQELYDMMDKHGFNDKYKLDKRK